MKSSHSPFGHHSSSTNYGSVASSHSSQMGAQKIKIKPSRKGLLHSKLGVPQGKPIPASKLQAAKNSSSPALRKEANFAINARKFSH